MPDAPNDSAIVRLQAVLEGRYDIERRLGAGAMATVYLAEDLRHRRKVAVKVLEPSVAADLGADRFLAEIRTTANLQHPHIVPLFDSGAADGIFFYVMPLISGESLRDRLDRENQLPVGEAVAITRAVATALDYAHRHGIVHRDIKPANILLHDGQPMVSDLGIALAVSTAEPGRLTGSGLSIGTPQYMSPEQAAGDRSIDGRSDIYSLGCVAYEMLAGQPVFAARSAHAVIAQILTEEPVPLTKRRPTVPGHVSSAVARALEKLPADRFATAAEFARALDDEAFRWPRPTSAAGRGIRSPGLGAVIGLAGVILAAAIWTGTRPTVASPPTIRLAFTIPDDQFLPAGGQSWQVLDLSPDGTHLVYVGQRGLETQLHVRDLGTYAVRALPGTAGAREPFFSPDGQWVGFFADGRLRKVPVGGGIPIDIVAAPGRPYGASWGDDGTILYSLSGSSLWRVPAEGGSPTEIPLTFAPGGGSRQAGDTSAAMPVPAPAKWPFLLPSGTHALVAVGWRDEADRPNNAGLTGVVDLATGEFHTLFAGSRPRYVDGGYIVFDAGMETISVVRFDLKRLRTTTAAAPLVDNAKRSAGSGSNFSVSKTGVLAYPTGGFDRLLVTVDRFGRERPLGVAPRGFRVPSVSPDGRYIAVTVDPQPPQIWIVDVERERATPLATEGYNLAARWAHDGSHLTFVRMDVDTPGSYLTRWPDASRPALLHAGRAEAQVLPDSRLLLDTWDGDLAIIDPVSGTTTAFMATPATERQSRLSRDGNWVAFTSDLSGIDEVYVLPVSGSSMPVAVSSGGGADPRWASDGSGLFYRSGNTIFSVQARTAPTFELTGPVEPLFASQYDFSNASNWDVLPDGRFVFIKTNPRVGREIRLVFNGLEEGLDAAPRPRR